MNYTKEYTKKKIENISDENIDDDDDLLRFMRGGIGAKGTVWLKFYDCYYFC